MYAGMYVDDRIIKVLPLLSRCCYCFISIKFFLNIECIPSDYSKICNVRRRVPDNNHVDCNTVFTDPMKLDFISKTFVNSHFKYTTLTALSTFYNS